MDKVCSGLLVPVFKEDDAFCTTPLYVHKWSAEELESAAEKFVEELKGFVKEITEYYKERLKEDKQKLKLEELLELVADSIALFYKLFLYESLRLPIKKARKEGEKVKLVVPPIEVLSLWLLTRKRRKLQQDIWKNPLTVILSREKEKSNIYGVKYLADRIARALDRILYREEEGLREVERFTLYMPADTRPGLNTSKLLPHMLVTSALACIKAEAHGATKLERNILRIAALLHDIGKPIAWAKLIRTGVTGAHAKESAKIARKILEPLSDQELKQCLDLSESSREAIDYVINCICEIIEHHHTPDSAKEQYEELGVRVRSLTQILHDADCMESTTERLRNVIEEEVKGILGEVAWNNWDFWRSIPDDKYVKATESACTFLQDLRKVYERLMHRKEVQLQSTGNEVCGVAVIDVRGIQKFIRREELALLVAGSLAVDYFIAYAVPRALIERLGLPFEAILYAGGGTALALVRASSDSREKLESALKYASSFIGRNIRIEASSAITKLKETWIHTSLELFAALSARKALQIPEKLGFELGIEAACKTCGKAMGINSEGDKCEECQELEGLGKGFHFKAKIQELMKDVALKEKEVEGIEKWPAEFISGADPEELPKYYDLAVIKVDGNLMGKFMSSAITLADVIERSIRIDRALKKGISKSIEYILELSEELEEAEKGEREVLLNALRLWLGILYAGGDDALILAPSFLALPLALSMIYWFWRELGGKATLSAAIVSSKAKTNIWCILDTCEELLGKCKSEVRKYIANSGSEILGALVLLQSSAQPTPSLVDDLEELKRRGLSVQPFLITRPKKSSEPREALEKMFSTDFDNLVFTVLAPLLAPKDAIEESDVSKALGKARDNYYSMNPEKRIKELLKLCIGAFHGVRIAGSSRATEICKACRRAVVEASSVIEKFEDAAKSLREQGLIAAVYLSRRAARLKHLDEKLVYEAAASLLAKASQEGKVPLNDLCVLAQLILGGRS